MFNQYDPISILKQSCTQVGAELRSQGWNSPLSKYHPDGIRVIQSQIFPTCWSLRLWQHPRSEVWIAVLIWHKHKPTASEAGMWSHPTDMVYKSIETVLVQPDLMIYEELDSQLNSSAIARLINQTALLFREIQVMNRNTVLSKERPNG